MTARNIIVSFFAEKYNEVGSRERKKHEEQTYDMNSQGWLGNNTQINKDVWL